MLAGKGGHNYSRLLTLSALVVLAGCGVAKSESAAGPYAALFVQAREAATSQFERDVLADDKVTRAEYEEAVQRFVSCVEDLGAQVTLQDQDGYYIYAIGANTAAYDEAAVVCAPGTKALIEGLYVDTLTNPDNVDFDELIAQCFVEVGLVEAPFTGRDFLDLVEASGAVNLGDGANPNRAIDPSAEAIMASEEAGTCMANPSHYRTLDGGR